MNFQQTKTREDRVLSDEDPPDLLADLSPPAGAPPAHPARPPARARARGRLTIEVICKDHRWTRCEESQARIAAQEALKAAAHKRSGEMAGEMVIVLADDVFVQDLNARFRGIDRPTNVLAFRAGAPELGDVIIARDTLYREAGDKNITAHAHLAHLTVHGTLHLLGFDHDDDQNASIMEELEISILAKLELANPYHLDEEEF